MGPRESERGVRSMATRVMGGVTGPSLGPTPYALIPRISDTCTPTLTVLGIPCDAGALGAALDR